MAKSSCDVTSEDDDTLLCAKQVIDMMERKPQNLLDDYISTVSRPGCPDDRKPVHEKLLASVHRLGSLHTKVEDKIRMLTRLLEIPSSAISERDVIRMLGAETGDLVGSVVRVVDIYIGTSAENKETLLAKTLEFFNKVLANYDESMNIRSLVKGRSNICVTETTLVSLLHLNTNHVNLASDIFQTLSFILTDANVDILLGSSQILCSLLKTIEDFLEYVSKYSDRDITPGLRLIETLIRPKLQIHISISNQILRPLVRLFRGYPFDIEVIEGAVVSRILTIVRDILTKSSPICVSTFFSSAEISSDLDHLKKTLMEADSRTILNEIFAVNHSSHPGVGPKMKIRRQVSANTIKAKLVDDDNSSSVSPTSPVKNKRQEFSAPAPSTSVPHPRRVSNRPPAMSTSPKRHNPHSSSQILGQPAVFRSLNQEAGQEAPNPAFVNGKEEIKPGEIFFRRSKETTDINENDILEGAIQEFQRTYLHTKNEETDAGGEIEVESRTVSQAGKGLFDWMVDDDSDSSTDENIQEQLKPTDLEVSTELHSRMDKMNKNTDVDIDMDMEKLNQWNDDDVFAKTIQSQKPVEETFNENKPETPTIYQLTRNQLLSVKHSIRVELCEAERFFEIDAGFLATQICGMLNTVNGGKIYLGVKRNGIIKGVRLDWKQRDKTRQLLDKVLCYHLVPRVAAACADIKFVEVVDHSHRDVPLSVVEVTVRGELGVGEDPKFAACSLPQHQVNGFYVRRGADPEYNIKIR